ncbi:MAG: 4Fe-4S binding protein, partial [Oscillospiraceae bacterium]|nr:4Fe-4S binding protein [Oscillospiraceae bacterium]
MASVLRLKKSNCKNCYKCIRHCPVKSIRFSGNQAHVMEEDCVLCGQCVVVCPQNAKVIVDETEKVRVLLQSGDPVYVSLAPSFAANYEGIGIRGMEAALKQLGFAGVEETALGATVVKREYDRLLREEHRDIVISSCCHSVNLLIEKYFPEILPFLADVQSPMQAHCAAIKRAHPNAKTVFIGPCVAKKDEAQRYEGLVDGVLTFEELSVWMAQAGVTPLPQAEEDPDLSLARLFPTSGGILRTLTQRVPGYSYLVIDGMENVIAALEDIRQGKVHRCFIEMSACPGSCVNGPVMEHRKSLITSSLAVNAYAGSRDFPLAQPEPELLRKDFANLTRKQDLPSPMELQKILKRMGKNKPEDELNCGSCGYDTCREKAVAIYQGKADVSMCLPF